MADERIAFAGTLCADQIGKTVSGADKYGEQFSGVVQGVSHLGEAGEFLPAVTAVKLAGEVQHRLFSGQEVVTIS